MRLSGCCGSVEHDVNWFTVYRLRLTGYGLRFMAYSFETLRVWQESRRLVIAVYKLLDVFPILEKYALCDQLRRAIVSVPSNIAEGSGRILLKKQIHFLELSNCSLMESYNQLLIAADQNYIDNKSLDILRPDIDNVAKMLNGLRNSFLKKLNEQDNGKH